MSEALVHALLIDESGASRRIDWGGVRSWRPEQGFLWVHLDGRSDDSRRWLVEQAGLPAVVPNSLLAEETRPRAAAIGDAVQLVLRGVNLNPGADPEDMVSIRIWADGQRMITTRLRRVLAVEETIESIEQRPLQGPGDLLDRLVVRLVDRVQEVVDDLDERADSLEEDVVREPDQRMRVALAGVRREAIALRRYLAPQREALARLQAEPLSWFGDEDRLRLREAQDRQMRHLEDLDALRERAAVVQEELINQLTDQLNRRMYVLSVFTVLFLPLGFLTGLLGVNLGGIPGAEHPRAFTAFAIALVVLLASMAAWFVRKRWL